MATPNCWRCLARPSQRLLRPATMAIPTPSAPFSTSTSRPAKEEGSLTRHVRTGKKLVLGKKKKKPDSGKPVPPGERKAFRKRILLSNDNALEVAGLPPLSAENIVDPNAIGTMVGLPDRLIDQLRTSEAFKPTQNWGLFRKPHMLIRKETVDFLKNITDKVNKKETARVVITGEKGSGKSMLGLQSLSAGFLNKYVVINIPEGQDLTIAATEYQEIPKSDQFSQPVYLLKLMQTIQETNRDILSNLHIQLDHIHLPFNAPRTMSLASLATATKEHDFAWPTFLALWQELLLPGRPPIMLNLDGLNHIMRVSDYRSPAFKLIHSHDLALLKLFTEALGGKTKFVNGAAIVGVTTKSNCPKLASVDKALEQAAAAQANLPIPPRDAFNTKYDERVFDALKGVSVFDVKGVSKAEARSLMEYWAASGVLRMRVDERSVSERWTLAGNGVLGEMERTSLYAVRL
ncbi:putative Mitochondrial ribosomal death-associated protein 3-domain-containing protein [Seiridium cardinale]|uniref:Small ribosomal subunit protein mS29 n=1 Tax=Seiridium cardinale TaxID=138064 RepID=A0ABR2XCQ0_9PEZI